MRSLDHERFFPHSESLTDYVFNCSPRFGYYYVETPKVACSTIKRVLQLVEVDGDPALVPDDPHDRERSPIPRLREAGLDLGAVIADPRYLAFTFVRNPLTRVVSGYLDKFVRDAEERARLAPLIGLDPQGPLITLMEYLRALAEPGNLTRDLHWAPLTYILQPDAVRYDIFGRFENFTASFTAILELLAPAHAHLASTFRLDPHRTGSSALVRELVGSVEQRLIASLYEEDFDRFAYSRQVRFASL